MRGVALVLTQAHLLEHLASHTVLGVARSLWCLDRDWHQVQAYAQSDLVNRTTPHAEPGLLHLHLRLHGQAQGRQQYSRRHRQPPALDGERLRDRPFRLHPA